MNERSPTLKSKPSNSPKSNDSDSNSSASGSSPRSSPKLTSKQLKNKTLSAMLTSQQKMKNVQPIGPALNAAKTSTVNSGGFAISGNVSPSASSNISLMSAFHQANNSSSQTHPLVPSPSSAPPSSSNVGASNSSSSNSPLTASPSGLSPVSPGFKNGALSKSNSMHKKSKGSLSAVIDKLRVTASTGGDEQSSTSTILSSSQHATSDTGKFVQLNNGANVLSTNSSNSLSSGNTSVSCSSIGQSPLNATTGTSNNGNISAAKLPDAKLKHNRPEFTVKQSLGGTLKLTVTKTKGQGGVGSSGSLHSNKLASKTSSGIKRQWQSGGNFKNGQSSSLTQKQQQQQQRPLSPESADQILEAALPKIQLDKLPKIPKTASSQNQVNPSNAFNSGPGSIGTTAAAANPSAAFKGNMGTNKYGALNKHSLSLRQQLQHNNSNIALMQSSSAGSTMAGTLMPPPPISSHYRKFGPRELPPPHLLQSHSPSSSSPSVSHPIPFSSSDTQPPPYHPVSSSGSRLERIFAFKMDAAANSTNDPRLQMKYNESSSNLSSLSAASSNSNFIPNSIVVTSSSSSSAAPSSSFGINSSVLVSAASSTPSSPLECGGPTDGNPKTPTLIPTERLSLEESNLNDPLKLNQIHPTSTSNVSSSLKEPKFISKLATVTTIDDDDDTERLTIDVPALSCSTATAASSSKDANPMKVRLFHFFSSYKGKN